MARRGASSMPTSPEYLVPVNADVPDIQAILVVRTTKSLSNRHLGAKGIGEVADDRVWRRRWRTP